MTPAARAQLFRRAIDERTIELIYNEGPLTAYEKQRCARCNISRGTHRFIQASPVYSKALDHPFKDAGPVVSWWLSFIDPHRPQGTRSLGVVIVDLADGATLVDAAMRAHELRINPGGECSGGPLVGMTVSPALKHRLLPPDEARRIASTL